MKPLLDNKSVFKETILAMDECLEKKVIYAGMLLQESVKHFTESKNASLKLMPRCNNKSVSRETGLDLGRGVWSFGPALQYKGRKRNM